MVDFQSRDTSRGLDDEAGADEEEEEEEDAAADTTDARADAAREEEEQASTTRNPDSTPEAVDSGVSFAILVTDDEGTSAADVVDEALDGEHVVLGRDERTGDLDGIQSAVNTFLDQSAVDAIVTVGGVDVGPAQVTVGAVEPLLDTTLPGFGELFRRRYAEAAGSDAVRSRAFAGIADSTPVFCLPSNGEAARIATEELVTPEVGGLVSDADGG